MNIAKITSVYGTTFEINLDRVVAASYEPLGEDKVAITIFHSFVVGDRIEIVADKDQIGLMEKS